jgi:hypothetical protein
MLGKYQFMNIMIAKNDSKMINTADDFQIGMGSVRGMGECNTVSSSKIKDGITSILAGTDSGKKFGAGSFYLLFGKRVE